MQIESEASWVYSHAAVLGALKVGKYVRFEWNRVLERLYKTSEVTPPLGSQPNDLNKP